MSKGFPTFRLMVAVMFPAWKYLLAGLFLGTVWGVLSARMNSNPYYATTPQGPVRTGEAQKAWTWRPSFLWLPSYVVCKAPSKGTGIDHTRSGYLFRSEADRNRYYLLSAMVGLVTGSILGLCVFVTTRTLPYARRSRPGGT